jgi:hypothetical protein
LYYISDEKKRSLKCFGTLKFLTTWTKQICSINPERMDILSLDIQP